MIPKNWEGSDFYKDLGIDPAASASEIKAAYRRLVREFHPDVNDSADRGERFRAITAAYTVLSDEKSRNLYDEYTQTFNHSSHRRPEPRKEKKNRVFGLLGRAALFILILLLIRNFGLLTPQTLTQTTNSASGQQSTVSGNSSNQVLALMVGPQGPPGPAGVAGENGFIGMNGYQGKDGLPGAPGPVGEQGPIGPAGEQGIQGIQGIQGLQGLQGESVRVEVIASGDNTYCDGLGGARLIGASSTAVVCNGSGNGGGSGVIGTGYVNVGTCDSNVKISLESAYRSGEFKMNAIVINEIAGACDGQYLKTILKIKSGSIDGGSNYSAGDAIECSLQLDLDPASGSNANSVALTYTDCVNTTTNNSNFRLYDVYASDISTDPRALLIQISA